MSSTLCFAILALVACTTAAPSGWPVVTYAQSYSAQAVDHSVAQSVYPAVVPAAVAEPLVVAPQRLVAAPQPLVAASPYAAPYTAYPAAPLVSSPYVAW